MPRKDINLLPVELKEQKKTEKVKTSVGNFFLILLVVVGLIAIGSSLILINLKLTGDKQVKDGQRAQEKIKDLSVVEAESNRLESKIRSISQIISGKSKYSVLLSSVSKAAPSEATITSLTTFGENRISVSGTVQSYLVLSKFVTSLMDPALGGKLFSNADLTGASLDEISGKIRFSMVLYLKKDALK